METYNLQDANKESTPCAVVGNTPHVASSARHDVTPSAKKKNIPRPSLEDLPKMTDEELLKLLEDGKGHTKDFAEFMSCDFKRYDLTKELEKRGYAPGWHKEGASIPSSTSHTTYIEMKKTAVPKKRKTFTVSEETARRWDEFCEKIPYEMVATDAALNRFMDDYYARKIDFVFPRFEQNCQNS